MKKHVQVGAMKDCYIIAGRGMFFLKECTSEGYVKDCRMDGERRLVYLKTTEARDIGHQYNTVKVMKSIQHILYIIMYNMLFQAPVT